MCLWNPGDEEQKADRLAVASVGEEKQHEENTMRDVHIGKRGSETANEALQYDSSKKLQIHRRPQPRMCLLDILRVVRNKIGRSPVHVDDIHISAFGCIPRDGWTRESLHQRSVGLVSRRRCQRSQEK